LGFSRHTPIMTRTDSFSSRLPARSLSHGVARSSLIPSDLARFAPRMRKRCSMQPNPSLGGTTGARIFRSHHRCVQRRWAWGCSPGIPVRECFHGNDRISQVPGEPQFPSAHVLRPRPVETFQTACGTLAWPPISERRRHRRQNAFRGSIAWLSGSPPTYHALVSRRRARLASRCWSGSPGRALTRRVPTKGFNSLHVGFPPLPSFLAQSGLRFAPYKAKYNT